MANPNGDAFFVSSDETICIGFDAVAEPFIVAVDDAHTPRKSASSAISFTDAKSLRDWLSARISEMQGK